MKTPQYAPFGTIPVCVCDSIVLIKYAHFTYVSGRFATANNYLRLCFFSTRLAKQTGVSKWNKRACDLFCSHANMFWHLPSRIFKYNLSSYSFESTGSKCGCIFFTRRICWHFLQEKGTTNTTRFSYNVYKYELNFLCESNCWNAKLYQCNISKLVLIGLN